MASDNFTATDDTALETHDANWTSVSATYDVGSIEIIGNAVQHEGAWQESAAYYDGSTEDSSQIVFKAQSSIWVGRHVSVRMDTNQWGYGAYVANISGSNFTALYCTKNTAYFGGFGEISEAYDADHTVKITASGGATVTLTGYCDGTLIGTLEDSSSPIGSGHPGFWTSEAATIGNTIYDDWTDGAAGGASSTPSSTLARGIAVGMFKGMGIGSGQYP